MSTFFPVKHTCSVCGKTSEFTSLSSTNTCGSPDLDLRPPEMKRSTMPTWIEKCPFCGYVHFSVEEDGKRHAGFIRSDEYKTCENNPIRSNLARAFYRLAMLLKRDRKRKDAYGVFLYAAWACDDVGDADGARICRGKAIELFDDEMKKDGNYLLRHVDLLRRTGRFDEAIELCGSRFDDELLQMIAQYQIELCQKKDMRRHLVSDCDQDDRND